MVAFMQIISHVTHLIFRTRKIRFSSKQIYRQISNVATSIASSHKNDPFFAGQQGFLRFEGCFSSVSRKIQAFLAGRIRRLNQFVSFAEVLDAELGAGCAAVVVLHDGIADIYRITGLDVVEIVSHIECYG